ncbi:branched-chain amino acid ABC transporter permease [Iamia sp. SCSIO 61187]|uniref:branched-chain amino acid ABC transporter permease n=1 Tax=Iamia sp. SCSIO 61187 TaxID=2722752 RepID=UPI001C62F07F|nr:branched-chain amino acid ABC transporter permease [Iamia sp. SCSIO 61187]QYG91380.1 branched-chain amino acid ABC transporter permease [Iamia sp. SCSIO 61187]
MKRSHLRIVIGILAAAALLYAPYYFQAPMNQTLSRAIYFAVAAMGLNLLTGFNGQVSIGHGAFFGVGAFATAILMEDHSWTFEATIPIAALVAAALGVLVGIPALRVKGLYLALVTLGLAVLFPRVGQKYVTGSGGVAIVRPPRDGFDSLLTFLENDQWHYIESLLIAAVLFLGAWNLSRSRIGRAMVAVRDQEIAASTVGVHLARIKVGAFALSAAYAGIAGSLSVMVDRAADATDPIITFRNSIEFLVAVVIGGTATISGPAVGALILILLREETDGLIEGKEVLSPAIFGGALIAMVYVLPGGVVGGLRKLADRLLPLRDDPTAPVAAAALERERAAADATESPP